MNIGKYIAGIFGIRRKAENIPADLSAVEEVHLWKGTQEQVFQKEALTEELVSDLIAKVLKRGSTRLVITYLFQGEGMYVKKLKKRIYSPYHCYLVLHHADRKLACLYFVGNTQHCHLLISDFYAYRKVDAKDIKQIPLGDAVLPEYGVHSGNENIYKALRSILQNPEAADKELLDSELWSSQITRGDVGYQKLQKEWGLLQVNG